jgi:hypothetical protein
MSAISAAWVLLPFVANDHSGSSDVLIVEEIVDASVWNVSVPSFSVSPSVIVMSEMSVYVGDPKVPPVCISSVVPCPVT